MPETAETKSCVCIKCPKGCNLEVQLNASGEIISVSGNSCPRGVKYGQAEVTHPVRVLTTLVACADKTYGPASVKTDGAIPKELIAGALQTAHSLRVSKEVSRGEVLLSDVEGSGVALVVTRPPTQLF